MYATSRRSSFPGGNTPGVATMASPMISRKELERLPPPPRSQVQRGSQALPARDRRREPGLYRRARERPGAEVPGTRPAQWTRPGDIFLTALGYLGGRP